MEYKKAIDTLVKLLGKHLLDAREKEAVLTAIGVLGWASLGKSKVKAKIKAIKAKRDKNTEW